jgi:hypothetical protein
VNLNKSRAAMPAMGLTSDKTHVEHNESAPALIADIAGDMDFRRNGPICGRLWVGKKNLHFPALVGAAVGA